MFESQSAIAAQQIGSGVSGVPVEESAVLASLGHWPGIAATTGWNAHRIQNTILHGGTSRSGRMPKSGHTLRTGMSQNLNPRSWGRLANSGQVHGYNGSYSPANFLGNTSSKLFEKFVGGADADSAIRKRAIAHGVDVGDKDAFQSGALGKFSASNKLYNKRKISQKKIDNVASYIKKNDADLFKHIDNILPEGDMVGTFGSKKLEAKAMGDFVSMTGSHTATNLVGGYMSGARGAVHDTVRNVATAAGKESWVKGAAMAERHLALGGLEHAGSKLILSETGKKAGLSGIKAGFGKALATEAGTAAAARFGSAVGMKAIGMAIPGVNVAMTAWMAYDIAAGVAEMGKAGVKLVKDGIVSMKGSIDKPIMGMGFRDNEIAATSRARGVSAIQNSRLNARSVLGNEAASMASHFG